MKGFSYSVVSTYVLLTGVKKPQHPYTANLDNLNKIFANTTIEDAEENDDLGDKRCACRL